MIGKSKYLRRVRFGLTDGGGGARDGGLVPPVGSGLGGRVPPGEGVLPGGTIPSPVPGPPVMPVGSPHCGRGHCAPGSLVVTEIWHWKNKPALSANLKTWDSRPETNFR